MQTNTPPAWRSLPATPQRRWWYTTLWVPTGYAATWFISDHRALPASVALAGLVAVLHRLVPGLVEIVAGGGGLVLSMFAAADGYGDDVLAHGGAVVVLVYGSLMWVSAFVRLLGSANGREMAKHLLVGTAALQLSLFAVSPTGRDVVGADDQLGSPVVLISSLLIATLVGIRARLGFPLLGGALVFVLAFLLVQDGPAIADPAAALAGAVAFAVVARVLANPGDDVPDLALE